MSPIRFCEVAGCERRRHGQGFCKPHYQRWRRTGDPLKARRYTMGTPTERVMARVTQKPGPLATNCWVSDLGINPDGYSLVITAGKTSSSHRVMYEALVGPIPAGLVIDHLCRVTACVNPEHLEQVTPQVNTLRGDSKAAIAIRRGTCKWGHPLTDAYVRPDGKGRVCRVCAADRRAAA